MIIGVANQGAQVTVLANRAAPHVKTLIEAGVKVIDVDWEKKLDRRVLGLIRAQIDENNVDLIHAFTHRAVLHMVLASRGRRVRLVGYRGVTGNVSWWSPLSWLRFLNPRIDRIICVTDDIRQHLLGLQLLHFRLAPEKVVTIHKGHDLSWYRDQPADLSQFGIPPDAIVACCSSRLRRRKGLWDIVSAVSRSDGESLHVLFVGHEGNDSLHRAIQQSGCPERFHFAGFRRDAPAIMAAADICLMPSHYEGLPRAVIEAMAYGVAPLLSSVGGHPELVENDVHGVLIEPGDIEALAAGLTRLADDAAWREQLGQAARQRIASDFRIQDTTAKTLDVYRELLSMPSTGAAV